MDMIVRANVTEPSLLLSRRREGGIGDRRETPQRRALEWVAAEHVGSNYDAVGEALLREGHGLNIRRESEAVMTRYSLAVLYYSTNNVDGARDGRGGSDDVE